MSFKFTGNFRLYMCSQAVHVTSEKYFIDTYKPCLRVLYDCCVACVTTFTAPLNLAAASNNKELLKFKAQPFISSARLPAFA